MTWLSILLYLVVAAVCAGIAEVIVPAAIPGGFLTSAIVGIIGAWIGSRLMGHIGPTLAGVPLIAAIVGSAIFVLGISLLQMVHV